MEYNCNNTNECTVRVYIIILLYTSYMYNIIIHRADNAAVHTHTSDVTDQQLFK